MSDHTSGHRGKNARRGLATIAFLKARFDAGMDHLDMFQPFVEDAIRHYEEDDIDVAGVQGAVRDLTGLSIPADIVKTLLRRAAKKGLLTRGGGRYLRTQHYDEDPELAARIRELGLAHLDLAARLRQFAARRGEELKSDDDALAALTRFLDANHIGVVLGQPIQMRSPDGVARLDHAVAAFVADLVEEGGPDCAVLEGIVKGFIVQNALLLRDIPITGRHLDGLTVFVDTGVLLRALGYAGPMEQQAATEALGLIRAAGARLYAFERTVNEVENILRVYESKLGSSTGTRSLRGTPLTYYFLKTKATPADIRQEIALLRKNLGTLGIRMREFPRHIHQHTEDEQALADALKNPRKSQNSDDDSRVWHDVEAVAAVITLRAGARPSQVPNAKYVFASGSSYTVLTAARWYRESYPHGLEPIVHFRSVTNAAWFLRPADASDVPMHDLVAVCATVLRPSPEVWSSFVRRLDELVTSGDLSDDESIAVLATGFTRIELADLESEADVEATTVREIVERVREEHETKLRSQLDDGQRKLEESERAAVAARAEATLIRSAAQAQAERLATWAAGAIYAVLCSVLLLGAILTLPMEWVDSTRVDHVLKFALWGCIALFFVFSLLGFFTRRFHVLNVFDRLKARFASRLQRMLLPEADHGDS